MYPEGHESCRMIDRLRDGHASVVANTLRPNDLRLCIINKHKITRGTRGRRPALREAVPAHGCLVKGADRTATVMAQSSEEFASAVLRTVVAKLAVLNGARQAQSMALNVVTDVVQRCTHPEPASRWCAAVGKKNSCCVCVHNSVLCVRCWCCTQTSRRLVTQRAASRKHLVRGRACALRQLWLVPSHTRVWL